MSNAAEDLNNYEKSILDDPPWNYIWFLGSILSALCLIMQIVLYIKRPTLRKSDPMMLTQLTVARLINSVLELLITRSLINLYTRDLMFAMFIQTDAASVCWTVVYTTKLYEEFVQVFVNKKCNFCVLSVLIWTVITIPLGVLCPVFLYCGHFIEYYNVYIILKLIVLTINVLFFFRIVFVIITKSYNSNRNFSAHIKTCAITFVLICIAGLQQLSLLIISDFLIQFSFDVNVSDKLLDSVLIINSYQTITITIIFLILAKNSTK